MWWTEPRGVEGKDVVEVSLVRWKLYPKTVDRLEATVPKLYIVELEDTVELEVAARLYDVVELEAVGLVVEEVGEADHVCRLERDLCAVDYYPSEFSCILS